MNKQPDLHQEASVWVSRLISGSATVQLANELAAWRSLSPAHDEAFRHASHVWRNLKSAGEELWQEEQDAQRGFNRSRRNLLLGSMAASVVGVMAARPPLGLWPSVGDVVADMNADYVTRTGKQKRIDLDGITLHINTRTRINKLRDSKVPGIELAAGEAFVDTTTSAETVFSIRGANCDATARNAAMNVRRDDGGFVVSCLRGIVRLSAAGGKQWQLMERQQVAYDAKAARLNEVRMIDPDIVSAWRDGLLVFREETLAEVINEVNRYRPGHIIVTNNELSARRVSGTFRIDRVEDVISHLTNVYGVQPTRLPGGVVLLG